MKHNTQMHTHINIHTTLEIKGKVKKNFFIPSDKNKWNGISPQELLKG